jgi:hypothetical protein
MRRRREGEARQEVTDAVNTDRHDDKLMCIVVGTRPPTWAGRNSVPEPEAMTRILQAV